MATIEEELKVAKQAKAAIEGMLTEETIRVLRTTSRMATEQMTTMSSAGPLNDARYKLGLTLLAVTGALEQGQPSEDELKNAKSAIDVWMKELEAAKP